MKEFSPIEKLFRIFDETAVILQEELSITYLEALAETAENLFHDEILQEEMNDFARKRVSKIYQEIKLATFDPEEIRQAYQLAILKGMKENVQPNHQMTPDSIGLFISYLLGRFMGGKKAYTIFDPAVGTGNLMMTILNQHRGKENMAIGSEVDDLLLKLAYAGANMLELPIQFYNQDSLEPLFIDPADAVVCDLPVGYYPNDVRANEFTLKADEGHSYAHHLFIEQSIRHTKPGGYLFFLIPNGLFESAEASKLHQFLQEAVHIQGVIQLPRTMFKQKQAAKSILILQKQGEGVSAPKQVLLADMPSMKEKRAMESIMGKLEGWFQENK